MRPSVAHHSDTSLIYFEKGDEVRLVAENSKTEFERISNTAATFSPDDNWLSYVDRNGEVYIARFPEMTNRVRISTEGGRFPRWSQDGSELFYTSEDNWMTSVPLEHQRNLIKPGQATRLFKPSQFNFNFEGRGIRCGTMHTTNVYDQLIVDKRPEVIVTREGEMLLLI